MLDKSWLVRDMYPLLVFNESLICGTTLHADLRVNFHKFISEVTSPNDLPLRLSKSKKKHSSRIMRHEFVTVPAVKLEQDVSEFFLSHSEHSLDQRTSIQCRIASIGRNVSVYLSVNKDITSHDATRISVVSQQSHCYAKLLIFHGN